MAWITPKKRGSIARRVGFQYESKKINITLGKCSLAVAESLRSLVQSLEEYRNLGQAPPQELVARAETYPTRVTNQLAKGNLIPQAAATGMTVQQLCDAWMTKKRQETDATSTINNHRRECDRLVELFGDRPVRSLKPSDAVTWIDHRSPQLASRYQFGRNYSNVRTIFQYAIKLKEISTNPFPKGLVKKPVRGDVRQHEYVTPETVKQVLGILPSNTWRLIFCLARYGGLRADSEFRTLQWKDVDFEAKTFEFWSPKDKATRRVPIFPELKPFMVAERKAFPDRKNIMPMQVKKGVVINQIVTKNWMDSGLRRILKRADIPLWPSLWQSLRVSAINDRVRAGDPLPFLNAVFGNSEDVRRLYYDMTLESDYERATQGSPLRFKAVK